MRVVFVEGVIFRVDELVYAISTSESTCLLHIKGAPIINLDETSVEELYEAIESSGEVH